MASEIDNSIPPLETITPLPSINPDLVPVARVPHFQFENSPPKIRDRKQIVILRKEDKTSPYTVHCDIVFRSEEAAQDVAVTLPEYREGKLYMANLTDIKAIEPEDFSH